MVGNSWTVRLRRCCVREEVSGSERGMRTCDFVAVEGRRRKKVFVVVVLGDVDVVVSPAGFEVGRVLSSLLG